MCDVRCDAATGKAESPVLSQCDGAPIPYSTDGLCGTQNGYTDCPAKFGLCCSEYG